MPQSVFHFKQFSIYQDRCAMKVGTDGVLLGSWVQTGDAQQILDIGTGTGLLALMVAQKSDARIDAIDIDEPSCIQASENVQSSPWKERINVSCASLQLFEPGKKYDLVIANPPYFIDSYLPDDEARKRARQATEALTYEDLLSGSLRLMNAEGRLSVILPYKEGNRFRELAMQSGLFNSRYCRVHSRKGKPVKRLLMEFSRKEAITVESDLILHDEGRAYSQQYCELTADYFPNLKSPTVVAP